MKSLTKLDLRQIVQRWDVAVTLGNRDVVAEVLANDHVLTYPDGETHPIQVLQVEVYAPEPSESSHALA